MYERWTRAAILGLDVDRDRDAEFVATGSVAALLARVRTIREQVSADLASIDPSAPLRGRPSNQYVGTPVAESGFGVLLHVLEELAQHHGHLELTRDLVAGRVNGQ